MIIDRSVRYDRRRECLRKYDLLLFCDCRWDHPGLEGEPDQSHHEAAGGRLLSGRVFGRRTLPPLHQPDITGASCRSSYPLSPWRNVSLASRDFIPGCFWCLGSRSVQECDGGERRTLPEEDFLVSRQSGQTLPHLHQRWSCEFILIII